MAGFRFERESRTPFSEAWTVEDSGGPVGRVDLHFTQAGIVYATLCVPPDFDEADLQDIIGEIDEGLVLTTDPYRDDLVVTVWRGTHAGVYSEEEDEDDDHDDDDDDEDGGGNGRTPLVLKPNP